MVDTGNLRIKRFIIEACKDGASGVNAKLAAINTAAAADTGPYKRQLALVDPNAFHIGAFTQFGNYPGPDIFVLRDITSYEDPTEAVQTGWGLGVKHGVRIFIAYKAQDAEEGEVCIDRYEQAFKEVFRNNEGLSVPGSPGQNVTGIYFSRAVPEPEVPMEPGLGMALSFYMSVWVTEQ